MLGLPMFSSLSGTCCTGINGSAEFSSSEDIATSLLSILYYKLKIIK